MLLTYFAPSDYVHGVFEHRGLVISLPKDFSCQSSSSDMVAINAFVYLSEYVVGVFLSYALEKGCGKAPFVNGSL